MDARGGLNFSNVVVLDAWPVVEYYVESDPPLWKSRSCCRAIRPWL